MKTFTVWVSRDNIPLDDPALDMWRKKPKAWGRSFDGNTWLYEFCHKEFSRLTGVKLKPGEKRKLTISVEEVST